MSFTELMLLYRCINTGPVSSFMGNIVGVFLVTYYWRGCDGVELCAGARRTHFPGGCKSPPEKKEGRSWEDAKEA